MYHQPAYRYSRREAPAYLARMLRDVHPRARFVHDLEDHRWHVVLEIPEWERTSREGARYDHVMVIERNSGEALEPCYAAVTAAYLVLVRHRLNQHVVEDAVREKSRRQALLWARERAERKAYAMDVFKTARRLEQRKGIESPSPYANLTREQKRELVEQDPHAKLVMDRIHGRVAPRRVGGMEVL